MILNKYEWTIPTKDLDSRVVGAILTIAAIVYPFDLEQRGQQQISILTLSTFELVT